MSFSKFWYYPEADTGVDSSGFHCPTPTQQQTIPDTIALDEVAAAVQKNASTNPVLRYPRVQRFPGNFATITNSHCFTA